MRASAEKPLAAMPAVLPTTLPATLDSEFVCARCAARRPARFHDPGAFAEPEPLPSGKRWAQEQAWRENQLSLEKMAKKALAVVRCPACLERDPLAVRRLLRPSLLPLAALTPVLFMAGVIATSSLFPGGGRLIPVVVGCTLILLAALPLTQRRFRQILREADAAIEFLP